MTSLGIITEDMIRLFHRLRLWHVQLVEYGDIVLVGPYHANVRKTWKSYCSLTLRSMTQPVIILVLLVHCKWISFRPIGTVLLLLWWFPMCWPHIPERHYYSAAWKSWCGEHSSSSTEYCTIFWRLDKNMSFVVNELKQYGLFKGTVQHFGSTI